MAATAMAPPTNAAFAKLVGCHFTTVSRWRSGDRLPGVLYLDRIASSCGIDRRLLQEVWERANADRRGSDRHAFARLLEERVFS